MVLWSHSRREQRQRNPLYFPSKTGYNAAMNISKTLYDEFKKLWNAGAFPHQRLGQAFFNHFDLHKMDRTKDDTLDRLYNADNITAEKMISTMIDWSN